MLRFTLDGKSAAACNVQRASRCPAELRSEVGHCCIRCRMVHAVRCHGTGTSCYDSDGCVAHVTCRT